MIYVILYLGAIVGANLIVTQFGPSASIVTAFLFIGLDLTSRDKLHQQWHGNGLVWKMAALVAAGSALSYILNRDAAQIAIASTLAFAAAAIVDTIVFHLLRHRPQWQRINGSNVPAALVDSIIFPTVAFGVWMPVIILGQFAAKVGGGFVWSLVLGIKRPTPAR